MKINVRLIAVLILLTSLIAIPLSAQRYSLSGYIKDQKNGEALIGVTLLSKKTNSGTATNSYGFYSLSLAPGENVISISYMGYQTKDTTLNVSENISLNIELKEDVKEIKEVVIKAKGARENVSSTKMSIVSLTSKTIKQVPVVFGEADVLKTLTMLPGVKTNDDGASAMSVRGGGRDQNLILLDEATVYNASHLGNLLSVFNNDAIQNIEFYKGNMPAQYGGRLSSLIDMRMKDGNSKTFSGSGGIGTLSSRLTLEGPIVKDKGSFIISGRRAYIDLLTKAIHAVRDTFAAVPYYFYDLNLKANYSINERNKIFVSGYLGQDVYKTESKATKTKNDFSWGNYTSTVRWSYIPSSKVFTNLTLLASNYNYQFVNELRYGKQEKIQSFNWKAHLQDYSVKYDVAIFANDKNTVRTGLIATLHNFTPGKITGREDTLKYAINMINKKAVEHAYYIQNEQKVGSSFIFNYGLRFALYHNLGKSSEFKLNNEYTTVDTSFYSKNELYHTYTSIEPRLAVTYIINPSNSIKAGFCRTSQFVHMASNSASASIIDMWVGSGPNIKPQYANLYSLGYFINLLDNTVEASVEAYYKTMENQIEFRENAMPQTNAHIDEDFRFGKGRSYGVEALMKKTEGRFTGWISYTYSKSERNIKDIQQKGWFLSTSDRPHDLSIVAMYDLTPRINFSANFVLKSGRPFTSPSLRYYYNGAVLPYFSKRNNDRMPIFHRLDLAMTYKFKQNPARSYHSEIVMSVFDVYNQNNPISIYFKPDEDNQNVTHAYKQGMFGFMPAISWNFYF